MDLKRNNTLFKKGIKYFFGIIFSLLCCFASGKDQKVIHIDSLTKTAYNKARIHADLSIENAHLALASAKKIKYSKGIADASLALGTAYLSKYNPNDSATHYYHKALDLYTKLENFEGMARSCYGLSYLYNFKSRVEDAVKYGNKSVKYFESAGNKKEMIAAMEAVVFLEKEEDNYERALELSEKAIQTARLIHDTAQWANALNNMGNIFKDMYLFNKAIDAYFEAFRFWEHKKDSTGLAIAYGSIANAYFFEGDYKKSLEYNFKKLTITKNKKNNWETNKTLNNIAISYSNLNKKDSALFYMHESLSIARKLNYPEGIANTYNNMASAYLSLGNTDSTLYYSSKAIQIAKNIKSSNLEKYELIKASALLKQKKYNDALDLAKNAYSLAQQKRDNHVLKDASWILNDIYYQLGQRDLAYPYLTHFLKLNDSIANMDYMRKVTRMDIQHEYETKQRKAEHEIDMLAKQNQLKNERLKKTWIVLIALFLLSIAGASISWLVIKNKDHRMEQMKLEIRNYLIQLEKLKPGLKKGNSLINLIENYDLTHREAEIMELIATGIGNEEIAEKLFVSKNTIKFHIKNIFIKLDVRNRVQALQKIAG